MAEQCGTVRAYNRHLRRGEKPCRACTDAASAYTRVHTLAVGRAKTRLTREFPERYYEILDEERAVVGLPPARRAVA